MNKNVLIYGLHNPAYLPLLRGLADAGFGLIVGGSQMMEIDAAGLDYCRLENLFTPELRSLARSKADNILENLENNLGVGAVAQAFSSPWGNFIPITGQQFFQNLDVLLETEILIIEALDKLLQCVEVHLIFLNCDNDCTERALVFGARRHGIPSLHVAHGLYSKPQVHIAGEVDRLSADYIALFGARARENFVGSGNPPERIFLTGAPLWDSLYRPEARIDAREARQRLGLAPDRPVVLFCTSYAEGSSAYYRDRARRMRAIQDAVVESLVRIGPDVQFMVRPHPNELSRFPISPEERAWIKEAYRHWLEQYGIATVHLSFDNKIEAIRAADVVIVADQSSMIPETMILERPVIMPTLLPGFQTTYSEADGIIIAADQDRLHEALAGLLRDPAAREAMVRRQNASLPDLNFGNDGRATERVVALAAKLAKPATAAPPRPSVAPPRRAETESRGLNILLAAHNFLPHAFAGTEIYTHDLARALERRGHQVRVLYCHLQDNDSHTGFALEDDYYQDLPVTKLYSPRRLYLTVHLEGLKPLLKSHFQENPVDLVHIQHLMGLSLSFLEVLQELEIPVVLTLNDFWSLCYQCHLMTPQGALCTGPETIDKCVRCWLHWNGLIKDEQMPHLFHLLADHHYSFRRALSIPDLVLCPSRFLLNLFKKYKFSNENMVHLPQGANLFQPLPPRPLPRSPLIFSYLGAICHRKGLDLLLDAFGSLETGGSELHIHGAIGTQSYYDGLIRDIPPDKKIFFHGRYAPEDLPQILAGTDVAVVPSRGENYPFVLREILHARVPVVAAAVAGIPEIVEDGVNGLLFAGNDYHDLAAKMSLLIKEPEIISRLQSSIKPIKSMDEDAADIEGYYRQVLSRREKTAAFRTAGASAAAVCACQEASSSTPKDPDSCWRPAAPGLTSIIIPVYNNLPLTRQCLESIWAHTGAAYEIIVADNGSGDGTREYLQAQAEAGRTRVITNSGNLGFARASNQGARTARGDYLLFLNNDTIVQPGWLEALTACARQDDRIGAVGAKLLYEDGSIQHAGVVFNTNKKVHHIYKYFGKDHPAVNKEREFQAVTGACLLIRKELFFAAGAFDENYLNGLEDLDLCFKLRHQGYRIVYTPNSEVFHLESKTPGRFEREAENFQVFKARWFDQVISDDNRYYQEDGIEIEMIGQDGQASNILAHDRNNNHFWEEARQYRQMGILFRAEDAYFRALKLNPFDPRIGLIAQELAELFDNQGKHTQAEPLHRLAADMAPRLHPRQAPAEIWENRA